MAQFFRALFLILAISTCSGSYFPHKECSFVEYITALSMCNFEISSVGAQEMMKYSYNFFDSIMGIYERLCSRDIIKRNIKCIHQVNKLCKFSYFSTEKMMKIEKYFCSKIPVFKKLKKCFLPKMEPFIECVKGIMYRKDSDPICRLVGDFKKCLKSHFKYCEEEGTEASFTLLDYFMLDKCSKISNNPTYDIEGQEKCSIANHFITSSMCWMPYGARLANDIPNLTESNITKACNSKDIKSALKCQGDIDGFCSISIVNSAEVTKSIPAICSSIKDFGSFGNCAVNFKPFSKCIQDQSKKDHSVCNYMKAVHGCLNIFLEKCPDSLRKMVLEVYEAIAPRPCSSNNKGDKCSLIEYLGNVGICWTSFALKMTEVFSKLPRSNPNPQLYFDSFCDKDAFKNSMRCHKKVDDMCEMSLITISKLEKMVNTFCDNNKHIIKFPMCFAKVAVKPSVKECAQRPSDPPTDGDGVCRMLESKTDCYNKEITKICHPVVGDMWYRVVQVALPKHCSSGVTSSVSIVLLAVLGASYTVLVY